MARAVLEFLNLSWILLQVTKLWRHKHETDPCCSSAEVSTAETAHNSVCNTYTIYSKGERQSKKPETPNKKQPIKNPKQTKNIYENKNRCSPNSWLARRGTDYQRWQSYRTINYLWKLKYIANLSVLNSWKTHSADHYKPLRLT